MACFVERMTSRIVLRSDVVHPNSFASGSFRDHAGLTLIANPQALGGYTMRLIDALVHESVHAAIYMFESLNYPLCQPAEFKVQSGWSGRNLTLDQYVQACFVWWGLLNLWYSWLPHNKESSASELYERAARGFHTYPVSALRKQAHGRHLSDDTWSALCNLEDRALSLVLTR